MIEFKGTYHQYAKADSVVVLVQFDGVILHVWHLSEPFHRLVSSDEFHLSRTNLAGSRHSIKLPNGGRIKTDDRHAFELLSQTQKRTTGYDSYALTQNLVLALLGFMSLGTGLWWLVRNGLLF
ncbi:MAG: hypothetical protein C4519_22965 [Desulfobacteraceae bacterium]|nr:MAG: hypothetical protein C4519_22965 [Desulfobacteraceae bacterium]